MFQSVPLHVLRTVAVDGIAAILAGPATSICTCDNVRKPASPEAVSARTSLRCCPSRPARDPRLCTILP